MKSFMKFLVGAILGVIALIGIKEAPVQAAAVSWEAPEWTDYKTAEFRWKLPSDFADYEWINIIVLKDGTEYSGLGNVPPSINPENEWSYSDSYVKNGYYYGRCPLAFDQSGVYTLKAVAREYDEVNYCEVEIKSSPESSGYNYTLPSSALPAPSNPRWVDHTGEEGYSDNGVFAFAECDPVQGACTYLYVWYIDNVSQYTMYNSWNVEYGWYSPNRMNFSYVIGDLSTHEYTFQVLAIPADITQFAPSAYSSMSDNYVASSNVVSGVTAIHDLGQNVQEANVNDTVEAIKSIDVLDTVLRTSDAALSDLRCIEDTYELVNNITENPPTSNVSGIDASEIQVVGASLNVSPGTTLGLNIGTPASYPAIDADKYKNALVFDMGIQASDGTDFSQELDIPVTIKLPIPGDLFYPNLKLLHFRADGSYEEVPYRLDGGFIVISVYHFSTFAFALGAEEETAEASLPPIITYNTKLQITGESGVPESILCTFAYTHQGEASSAKAAALAGKDAFCIASYNIHVYDKANYSRKTGRISFGLRSDMVVKNRTYFAVMIDKSGNAVIFNDLDTTDDKLTFDIDIEGYAIFIYFVDGPAPSASALAVTPSTPAGNTYIVQPGDTLGQIADKLGITAVELASINEIKNLNLIYPGQTIRY